MVTKEQIQDLVKVVSQETNAVKLFLFGSYVTGCADENSDVDLLVVIKEDIGKQERRDLIGSLSIKTIQDGLMFPKDFKVYSLREFNHLKENKNSFLHQILKQSIPLYGR